MQKDVDNMNGIVIGLEPVGVAHVLLVTLMISIFYQRFKVVSEYPNVVLLLLLL